MVSPKNERSSQLQKQRFIATQLLKLAQARQRIPKGEDETFHFFAEEIERHGFSLAAIEEGLRSLWAIPIDAINEYPPLDDLLRAIANREVKLRLPPDPWNQFRIARNFADNLAFFLERNFGTEAEFCAKWPQKAAAWRTWPRDSTGALIPPMGFED